MSVAELTVMQTVVVALIVGTGLNMLRYTVMAGSAWALFHRLGPRLFARRRIATRPQPEAQNRRDVGYSLLSTLIFGLSAVAVLLAARQGWGSLADDPMAHGAAWFWLQVPLMLVLHDAYFYWTHRAMHHKRLFRVFHKVHHLSRDPTPLTSYAFHPAEAVVEAGIGPLLVFLLPVHREAMLLFVTIQFAWNVWGHLGYELYPSWFGRSWLRCVFNTTTHHHQHHQKVNCNYGLYFNWWDRLLGTNHPDYDETLEEQTARSYVAADTTSVASAH